MHFFHCVCQSYFLKKIMYKAHVVSMQELTKEFKCPVVYGQHKYILSIYIALNEIKEHIFRIYNSIFQLKMECLLLIILLHKRMKKIQINSQIKNFWKGIF